MGNSNTSKEKSTQSYRLSSKALHTSNISVITFSNPTELEKGSKEARISHFADPKFIFQTPINVKARLK